MYVTIELGEESQSLEFELGFFFGRSGTPSGPPLFFFFFFFFFFFPSGLRCVAKERIR